jgi:TRAP transporter TAXI family solute receptor
MALEHWSLLTRRERLQLALMVIALVALGVYIYVALAKTVPSRRIVLASGPDFGAYHEYAKRYQALLAREGVRVGERMTGGAEDNLELLRNAKSGVDVAFMQGGVAPPGSDDLVMLASLYYEPLWIFYRGPSTLSQIVQLKGKRIAAGAPGSGTRAFVDQILGANGLTAAKDSGGAIILALGGSEALAALKAGDVDAVLFVGGAQSPAIQQALRVPGVKLMSLSDVEVYPRRFPYVTHLSLPRGTIDLALDIPDHNVAMIGTRAMLAAREDIHPALINVLIDAARAIHSQQGIFEAAGEFPSTEPMDIPVSPYADQHKRFGSNFLYHYLPFWLAALVERAVIVIVPLLVVLVPVMNLMPQLMHWRVRSRIHRWYGELAHVERDVQARSGASPVQQWLGELDRIEHAVEELKVPPKYANEVYTLREHIGLARRTVLRKAGEAAAAPSIQDDERAGGQVSRSTRA